MHKTLTLLAICAAFTTGMLISRDHPAAAASTNPTQGFTLHIDAERHFGEAHSTQIAHHWCKAVEGMTECLIFDGDANDARLVEVETIVSPAVYQTFTPQEQALWHYHKIEIPKVNAKLPDMTPAEAQNVAAGMMDTYGKVWMLWNPATTPHGDPVGRPTIVVLK